MRGCRTSTWQRIALVAGCLGGLCSCGATREQPSSAGAAGADTTLAGHAGESSTGGGSGGTPSTAGGASNVSGANAGGTRAAGGAGACLPNGDPPNDPNAKSWPLSVLGSGSFETVSPTTCAQGGAGGAPQLGQDACGCAGLDCPSPQVCVNAIVELGAACGQPLRANQCFTTCGSNADCEDDEICVPSFAANEVPRCFKARCRSDSDCCSGACRVSTGYFSQCHSNVVLSIDCR